MAMMSTQIRHPEMESALDQVIPGLCFDNRSDLDALHFDMIDQHGTPFHVIVAKTGYTIGSCNADGEATLIPMEVAAELNVEDQYYEDDLSKSVRQESDLAPYKPFCDVIVNAHAYAPRAVASQRFKVQLRVQRADRAAPLPERPLPLNPLQGLSPAVYDAWQKECARALKTRLPGAILIQKTLSVTGARYLKKKMWLINLMQFGLSLGSLGLFRSTPWRLTRPMPGLQIPLRYELAQGGQCRIESADMGARRVSKKHRLTEEQRAGHPDQEAAPIAHEASMTNPLGRGFAKPWYLDALKVKRLPAPQIEDPASPFTARQFWRDDGNHTVTEASGMGFIGRTWLPRRALIGNVEVKDNWQENEVPSLPEDFNFAYWNGAPIDQQCAHLSGGEQITLVNLCASDSSIASSNDRQETVLRFSLPEQSVYLLAAKSRANVNVVPLVIDTVTIDPEAQRVDLVWRICLPADGQLSEVRLMHSQGTEQNQRLAALLSPAAFDANLPTSSHLSK